MTSSLPWAPSGTYTKKRFQQVFDSHNHLRDNIIMPDGSVKNMLAVYIEEMILGGISGGRFMLNLQPAVSRVYGPDFLPPEDISKGYRTVEEYMKRFLDAGGGRLEYADFCLYLNGATTTKIIDEFVRWGGKSVKKYPHARKGASNATTNSEEAVPIEVLIQNGIPDAVQANGLVWCEHGEAADIPPYMYADGKVNVEAYHYLERAPRFIDRYKNIRYSAEHLTTVEGTNFVRDLGGQAIGTLCFQHMLYTVSDLMRDMNVFLACMPRVKSLYDMLCVWDAAFGDVNDYFCLGSDNAPHTANAKNKFCGCASGCYAGRHVLAEYATAFEMRGPWLTILNTIQDYADHLEPEAKLLHNLPRRSFDNDADCQVWENFTCHNGRRWNGVPPSKRHYTIERKEAEVVPLQTPDGPVIPLKLGIDFNSGNNAKLPLEQKSTTLPYTVSAA